MNDSIKNPSASLLFPRLSIRLVLWYKVLAWIEQATAQALLKASIRLCGICMLALLIFAPSFAAGYLAAIVKWNSYRIPIFCAVLALTLNARRIWRTARQASAKARGKANQHTYHGIAIPDLVTFLQETQSFKREDAIKRLALSQGQYAKIAAELEEKGVLTRGESNARVLRPIGREHLGMQLRDGFPLLWDPAREIWVERDGQFNHWVLNNEFKQRKISADIEKKQRRLEKIEEKIANAQTRPSPLARLFAHTA